MYIYKKPSHPQLVTGHKRRAKLCNYPFPCSLNVEALGARSGEPKRMSKKAVILYPMLLRDSYRMHY
jgi:hypothetical protein